MASSIGGERLHEPLRRRRASGDPGFLSCVPLNRAADIGEKFRLKAVPPLPVVPFNDAGSD